MSLNDGLMSDAVSIKAWRSASVWPLDDDEDFDDELDDLDEEEDDDDDDDELDELSELATTFFLSSPRSNKNAAIASTATASTPTMIHFALLDPGAPGGGPTGAPGGGPIGGPGGGVTGIAAVGGTGGTASVGGGEPPGAAGPPAWNSGC